MKTILLFATMSIFSSSTNSSVYICDSANAEKYHLTKDCQGLDKCKHTIKEVTLSEAKALGRELCSWED